MKHIAKKLTGFFAIFSAAVLITTVAPLQSIGIDNTTVVEAAVSMTTKSVSIPKGSKWTLKLNGNKKKVAWSSTKTAIASVKNGVVTAKKTGTTTITAKVGSKKYTCKVTVLNMKVNSNNVVMTKGKTYTLKVIGTSAKKSYRSSKTSVATVNSKTGKITAKKKGTAVITVKVGKSSFKVNVKVETPSLSKTTVTLSKGGTYTLKLKNTSRKVTWKSNNTSVATVNSAGKVTAKRNGQATITAKISDRSYNCTIKVGKKTVINCPNSISVSLGQTITYKITAGDGFKYGASKGFIDCTVTPKLFHTGQTLTMTITGKAVGTDTITLTSDGGWKKVINVTVKGTTLDSSTNGKVLNDVTINSFTAYHGVGKTPYYNIQGSFTNNCNDKLAELQVHYAFYDNSGAYIDGFYHRISNPVKGKSYQFNHIFKPTDSDYPTGVAKVVLTYVEGILTDSLKNATVASKVPLSIAANNTTCELSDISVKQTYYGSYNDIYNFDINYTLTNTGTEVTSCYVYYFFYDKEGTIVNQNSLDYTLKQLDPGETITINYKANEIYGTLKDGDIASIKCLVSPTILHQE